MALLIRGATRCPLCQTMIRESDEVIAFSPFVTNEADPLFVFSDAVLHADCVHRHPLDAKCERAYAESRERHAPDKRVCEVCHTAIDDPDEYFTTGYLSSDESRPLSAYNHFQAHRSCLTDWSGLEPLRRTLEEAHRRGELKGLGVPRLLDELQELLLKGSLR